MADYWISQPRKFCEFCKCWIADNKPSRDFHEKGKKHQQNVKDKISQVMKKGATDSKKESEMASMLKQMEQKAMNALKKDIQGNPSMAVQYGVTLKNKEPEPVPVVPEINSDGFSSSDDDESPETKKTAPPENEDSDALWKEEWTPEGYVYYWHTVTGETTWVAPEGYTPTWERPGAEQQKQRSAETDGVQSDTQKQPDSTDDSATTVADGTAEGRVTANRTASEDSLPPKNVPAPKPKPATPPQHSIPVSEIMLPADIPLPPEPASSKPPEPPQDNDEPVQESPRLAEQPEPEPSRLTAHSGPVRTKPSRYGSWETVPELTQQRDVDLQLPPKHAPTVEFKAIPMNEPKLKFRQKKVDTLGAEFMAFKKRKTNNTNRSLRTTDTEKD